MGDVKHPRLVGGSSAGKPRSFYCIFPPPRLQPKLFSFFSDVSDAAGEGREGVRASFPVHCFEELSCDLDWQRGPSSARG